MNDFESDIRAMLRQRAGDVGSTRPLSTWVDDGAHVAAPAHRRSPARALVVASVAAVLVVAGGVLGVRLLFAEDSGHVPAGPTPSTVLTPPPTMGTTSAKITSPVTTMQSSPAAVGGAGTPPVTAACVASWPVSWDAALTSAGSAFGAQSARPLAVDADGSVLVARDFGEGKARDLALVHTGSEPDVLFTIAAPQQMDIQSADLSGDNLVVGVGSDPRPPKGQVPGSSPMPNVQEIDVIDRTTGVRRVIAASDTDAAGAPMTIDSVAVIAGVVYWDVRSSYDDTSGTIEAYDLATGAKRTAYTGPDVVFYNGRDVSASGITIDGDLVVRTGLPSAVSAVVPGRYQSFVQTDGTAYAWLADADVIGWWQPGLAAPMYVRLASAPEDETFPSEIGVAGSLVIVGGTLVIDMTTAAVTTVPDARPPIVIAGHDVLVTTGRTGTGHWDSEGYWVDPGQQVTIANLDGLPRLACQH